MIRYIGGKRSFVPKLAPAIEKYLDDNGGAFYEPFAGGAAMTLALGRKGAISDVIEDLVNLYTAVRDEPLELIAQLEEMAEWGTEEENYYLVRDTEPGHWPADVAARMIYLSAHSFNGLWRTNQSGQMNAAYGKRSGRITEDLFKKIRKASKALANTDTHFSDFDKLLCRAGDGDLVYLDPPYHDTFVGYSGKGFNQADQERLALRMYEAMDRGAAVLVHNSDTPETRFWYEQLHVVVTKEARAVNRDGKGRGKTGCLLASNVPELLAAYS